MRRATDQERLEAAVQSLLRRIEVGEEFPDACWAVASRQNVSYEALQQAYDEHHQSGPKSGPIQGDSHGLVI